MAGFIGARRTSAAESDAFPPVRRITRGPRHHWFGYYDKLQFDPSVRYVLGMQVDFEHRSPTADDVIKIGMVDLGRQRSLDRARPKQGLVLATGLHVAMAAGISDRGAVE